MQHLHDSVGERTGCPDPRRPQRTPPSIGQCAHKRPKPPNGRWPASVQGSGCRRDGAGEKTKHRLADAERCSRIPKRQHVLLHISLCMRRRHIDWPHLLQYHRRRLRQATSATTWTTNRDHGDCLAFSLCKHCEGQLLRPHAATALKKIICGRCSKRWPCPCSPWADPPSQLLTLTGSFMLINSLVALADASTPNAVWPRALLPQRSMKDRS